MALMESMQKGPGFVSVEARGVEELLSGPTTVLKSVVASIQRRRSRAGCLEHVLM